jgi:hypothetical protein
MSCSPDVLPAGRWRSLLLQATTDIQGTSGLDLVSGARLCTLHAGPCENCLYPIQQMVVGLWQSVGRVFAKETALAISMRSMRFGEYVRGRFALRRYAQRAAEDGHEPALRLRAVNGPRLRYPDRLLSTVAEVHWPSHELALVTLREPGAFQLLIAYDARAPCSSGRELDPGHTQRGNIVS